jgi:hypothetical protein
MFEGGSFLMVVPAESAVQALHVDSKQQAMVSQ